MSSRQIILFCKFIVLIFIITVSVGSSCQEVDKLFHNFNSKNVLTTSTIYKSVADKNGNIWSATGDGLLFYNGIEFEKISVIANDQDVINVSAVKNYIVAYTFSYDVILIDPDTRKQKIIDFQFKDNLRYFIWQSFLKNDTLFWWTKNDRNFSIPLSQLHIDSSLHFREQNSSFIDFIHRYKNYEKISAFFNPTIFNFKMTDSFLVHDSNVYKINNIGFTKLELPDIKNNISSIRQVKKFLYVSYTDGNGLLKYNIDGNYKCTLIDTILKNENITGFLIQDKSIWISTYYKGIFLIDLYNQGNEYVQQFTDILYIKRFTDSTFIVTKNRINILKNGKLIFEYRIENTSLKKIFDVIKFKSDFYIVANNTVFEIRAGLKKITSRSESYNIKDITHWNNDIIFRQKNSSYSFDNGNFKNFQFKNEPSVLCTSIAIDSSNQVYFGTAEGLYKERKHITELGKNRILKIRLNNEFLFVYTQVGCFIYNCKTNEYKKLKSLQNLNINDIKPFKNHFIVNTENEIIAINYSTLKTDYYFTSKYFDNNISFNSIQLHENKLLVATNKGYFELELNLHAQKIYPTAKMGHNNDFKNLYDHNYTLFEQNNKIDIRLQFKNTYDLVFHANYAIQVFNSYNQLIYYSDNIINSDKQFYSLPYDRYRIEIIEKNTDEIIKTFLFEITPYWYQTKLFKFLIAIASLIATIFISFYFINKKNETVIKKSKQQLELIQSQIKSNTLQLNAHLIFNLLNPLNFFIVTNNKNDALSYLKLFTKFMRQLFSKTSHEYHSISEFIEFMHSYLRIQQLRFNNHFNYRIINEIQDPITTKIPLLLIVPMVENAIEHGILPYYANKKNNNELALEIKIIMDKEAIIISILNLVMYDKINFEKSGHSLEVVKKHLDLIRRIYGIGEIEFFKLNSHVLTEIKLPTNLTN